MAAVYKTVSKKTARQLTEDMDEDSDIPMDELLEDADDTTDSEEEEVEDRIAEARRQLAAGMMPKTRVLILTSRGVTHRSVSSINALQ
jgi:ribosome biogenesis protein BRX1